MFDIGFWEILIILLVALLVVGPDRLPGLAREVGLWVRKLRSFATSVRSDIEQEFQTEELRKLLNEQNREIDQLKNLMKDTEDALRSTEENLQSEMKETSYLVKSIENEVKGETESSAGGDFESEAAEHVKRRQAGAPEGPGGGPDAAETPPARKDRDDPQT
ncbi:Sec-independent protein translocase protein TatB [Thioalkalivibrio thiocyanodenitrificans]|uniref:Sec-independent protein translocase protein TatB n=1 Tax=Thioalkalivibrio thiocyanodenitrificans TaxID=243063 RepID=UPI00036A1249|nr:Sec-independent protein translocase protein TatB [Thioalkalivibrio thiocyanodenitrificans]